MNDIERAIKYMAEESYQSHLRRVIKCKQEYV